MPVQTALTGQQPDPRRIAGSVRQQTVDHALIRAPE